MNFKGFSSALESQKLIQVLFKDFKEYFYSSRSSLTDNSPRSGCTKHSTWRRICGKNWRLWVGQKCL